MSELRRPTYETDLVRLYCADAAEVVPHLEDVDLLATDPPYGVEYRSNFRNESLDVMQGDGRGDADRAHVVTILRASVMRLRRGRHVYIFGPPEPMREIERLTAHTTLVWDKGIIGMGNLSLPRGPSHEPINFAVTQLSKANREAGRGQLSARLRQGSVIRCARPNSLAVRHPSEKPVDVMRQIVESSSCLGELVLDPFMGTGATVIAAILTGRRAIGVEKDPKHFEVARWRVEELTRLLPQLESA
jgi:DNA modification methylase